MPSRKVLSILIICLSLVTAIMLSTEGSSNQSTYKGILSKGPEVKLSSNVKSDWQAELGELLPPKTSLSYSTSSAEVPSNLTDTVSESLMANYFSLKQSGKLDSSSASDLINQTIGYINSQDSQATKVYTTADIVVLSDNSSGALSKYGSDLGLIIKTNKPPTEWNPILLLAEALQNKDTSKAELLKTVAIYYRNAELSLARTAAPSSLTTEHLAALNATDALVISINNMSEILSDPLKAMSGLSQYQSGLANLIAAVNKIQQKLKEAGVVYKQGDNGYYLYYNL